MRTLKNVNNFATKVRTWDRDNNGNKVTELLPTRKLVTHQEVLVSFAWLFYYRVTQFVSRFKFVKYLCADMKRLIITGIEVCNFLSLLYTPITIFLGMIPTIIQFSSYVKALLRLVNSLCNPYCSLDSLWRDSASYHTKMLKTRRKGELQNLVLQILLPFAKNFPKR